MRRLNMFITYIDIYVNKERVVLKKVCSHAQPNYYNTIFEIPSMVNYHTTIDGKKNATISDIIPKLIIQALISYDNTIFFV